MKKGAVAFLDILGFKGIWQSRPESEVLHLLTEVPSVIGESYSRAKKGEGWSNMPSPEVVVLSDTIVMTMDSDDPRVLLLLGNSLYSVMQHFLARDMFVRGAIGFGEYSKSGNTFLGPAIDDVASWYEAADWIGVVATPTTGYMIDLFSPPMEMGVNKFLVRQFVKYDVPGKNGSNFRLNAFNWPGYLQAGYAEIPGEGKSESRAFMETLFSKQTPLGGAVLTKYENTLKFVDVGAKLIRPRE